MKRLMALCLIMLLCIGVLSGCGDSYDAEQNTVFILKDGKVITTDVETFDETEYDQAGLETYINEHISGYIAEHGEDAVKLEELKVEEGIAKMTISYAAAKDYSEFNGIELFTGSMAEALAAGYSFDSKFVEVKDGVAGEEVATTVFKGNDDYKVVVIKANTRVEVKGKIAYVSSENVVLDGKNAVVIKPNSSVAGAAPETEAETESIPEAEPTEGIEESVESVDEGELDVGTEETEIVFEFPEETQQEQQEQSGEASLVTNVYTYIIYK